MISWCERIKKSIEINELKKQKEQYLIHEQKQKDLLIRNKKIHEHYLILIQYYESNMKTLIIDYLIYIQDYLVLI